MFALLMISLFVISSAAGCAKKPAGPDTDSKPTDDGSQNVSPQPSDSPEPSKDLMDGSEVLGEQGNLWKVINEKLSGLDSFDVKAVFQDCLLITYSDENENPDEKTACHIILMDINTGDIRAEAEYQVEDVFNVQSCGDRIALSSWGDGSLYILDKNLKQTVSYNLADGWASVYVDSAAHYAYSFPSDGRIYRTDLSVNNTDSTAGAESTVELFPEASSIYIAENHEASLTISYELQDMTHLAHLDLNTSEIKDFPFEGNYPTAGCLGGLWLAGDQQGSYVIGRNQTLKKFSGGEFTFTLTDGPAPLSGTAYLDDGMQQIKLFREDGQPFASALFKNEWGSPSNPVWCEARNGYFLTLTTADEKTELLFWSAAKSSQDSPLVMEDNAGNNENTDSELPKELQDRITALSEKYGVIIFAGGNCETKWDSYTVETVNDPLLIEKSLNILEVALSSYPEGFIKQLPFGYFREIHIYLMGNISDENADENAVFNNFIGFVSRKNGSQNMVLNIHDRGLVQTIYHEFSHIIDTKLDYLSGTGKISYSEEGWCALNPPDFHYAESFSVIPESFYHDNYNGYFVELYSRTFSTEDRAKIMEHAMMNHSYLFTGEFYQPLRNKLAYYAAAIREAFDTEGWPEITAWERPLHEQ